MPIAETLEQLNGWVDAAELSMLSSESLVTAARLLVEALIERKVSEADLITAAHNPDDRALLARLRTDGLDGDGDPLFADLDALTTLLAQAQGEQRP